MNERQRELIAELRRVEQNNPLERYNNPRRPKVHQKQLEFHAIQAPPLGIKALIAANRSGKTVACIVDDIIQMVDERLVPLHLKAFKKWNEPITVWIGAPKNDTHFKNSVPLFRKFLPKEALIDGSFAKSFRSQPAPELKLANGSTVAFKTYDQDLDAWASAEVHRIHWDEEPNISKSRELRSEASARLISTNGDEIIGMTPLLGYSWVHDEVWAVRDEDPSVSVVQMRMEDNPWNSPEAIAKFASRLTEDEKRMRLNGEFVSLGGLFFDEFDRDLHVVPAITPDHLKGQDVVCTIDPGRDRTGVTWMSFDKKNRALVFDEYSPAKATVASVATEIKVRNKAWGLKPLEVTYVIDPSSRNENAINADKVEAAFSREEIHCQWGQNNRAAGILEMKRRFQEKDDKDKPAPSLLYCENCPTAIHQTERYARDPKSQDEWKAVPQTPNNRHDVVDTVRYGVMSRTFFGPDDEPIERTAFQPNFQPPYSEEIFISETPPMGAFS